jgi:hypothetical protein
MHVAFYILSFLGIKKPEFAPEEVDRYPEVPINPMPQAEALEIVESHKDQPAVIDERKEETREMISPWRTSMTLHPLTAERHNILYICVL